MNIRLFLTTPFFYRFRILTVLLLFNLVSGTFLAQAVIDPAEETVREAIRAIGLIKRNSR